MSTDEFGLVRVQAAPANRPMLPLQYGILTCAAPRQPGRIARRRRAGALRTISFAVGLMLGSMTAVAARSDAGEIDRHPHMPPTVRSALQSDDADREVQRLYEEIMRRADPALQERCYGGGSACAAGIVAEGS